MGADTFIGGGEASGWPLPSSVTRRPTRADPMSMGRTSGGPSFQDSARGRPIGMAPSAPRREPLIAWMPYAAREALELLRRPGCSSLERALAASVLVTALKAIVARGPVSPTWISLIEAEIQRHVPNLIEEDDLTAKRSR